MAETNSFIRPDTLWRSLGLRAQQTVVHLGCGAGFYLIAAAKIVGKNGKVIGVDVRPDILAEVENKARQHGVTVHTMRANVENTPGSAIPDKSVDWVLVANILHQSDPYKILTEAKRIVAANGHVAVVEWNTSATPFGPPVEKRRHDNEMKEIAESLGLTQIKKFEPSPYHFGLIFASQ